MRFMSKVHLFTVVINMSSGQNNHVEYIDNHDLLQQYALYTDVE